MSAWLVGSRLDCASSPSGESGEFIQTYEDIPQGGEGQRPILAYRARTIFTCRSDELQRTIPRASLPLLLIRSIRNSHETDKDNAMFQLLQERTMLLRQRLSKPASV
jgi:hypothetical protein